MNNKFDELARGFAQSVTRRQALRRFGASLVVTALASLGLTNQARADRPPKFDKRCNGCVAPYGCNPADPNYAICYNYCYAKCVCSGCG